jgi:ADP-ribose pyrophosphatase
MPREIVHRGHKIQVAVDTEVLPDGRVIRRDVVLHPGAVVILPLVDAGHVCLVRNVRPVVGEELWEVPAGTLEPGEPVEQAAARELAEETGYHAGRWQRLGVFYPSPGVLGERLHLFVAAELTPGPQRLEADEQLTAHTVSWAQALAWVGDGTIRDLKTVAALLLWQQTAARKET